jgi:hypothetical protein
MAQSKGRSLGIFEPHEKTAEQRAQRQRQRLYQELGIQQLDVFGLRVPAMQQDGKWRAVSEGKPIDPRRCVVLERGHLLCAPVCCSGYLLAPDCHLNPAVCLSVCVTAWP